MKPITHISQLDLNKRYTYADYLGWRFSDRVELIKGWIKKMTPAPRRIHQKIGMNILSSFMPFFEQHACELYVAPFDVRLVKNAQDEYNQIDTVVQPDICVICDGNKLDERGCVGAPDLIVEILSPSSSKYDYNEKYNLYEESGVKEYWIANPEAKSLEIFVLNKNRYESLGIFSEYERRTEVTGKLFPDLTMTIAHVFET